MGVGSLRCAAPEHVSLSPRPATTAHCACLTPFRLSVLALVAFAPSSALALTSHALPAPPNKQLRAQCGEANDATQVPFPKVWEDFLGSQKTVPKLPAHLKGHYRFMSMIDFNQYDLATELDITNQDDYGNIEGRYQIWVPWGSRPEALCFRGDRLPMTGRYDGEKFSVQVMSSENGPGCHNFWLTLERGKEHYLQGKFNNSTSSWYYDAAE